MLQKLLYASLIVLTWVFTIAIIIGTIQRVSNGQ